MKMQMITTLTATLLIGSALAVSPVKSTPPASRDMQPLSYANVVKHFKSAGLRTTEVQKRCTVLFEGEWNNANVYNYCLIIVENSDEDVQVTFYLTDAHEMNWITEFLDAPFFAREETEKLFGVLNSSHDVRNQRIGRFRVDYHRWQPKHAQILVFSFTAPRKG